RLRYASSIDGLSFDEDNGDIKALYKPTFNYRVGAEFRKDIWRLRAGYSLLTSALEGQGESGKPVSTITGGVGARMKKFYVDLALIHGSSQHQSQPYTFFDGSGPVVEIKDRTLRGVLTVGFTF